MQHLRQLSICDVWVLVLSPLHTSWRFSGTCAAAVLGSLPAPQLRAARAMRAL